MASEYKLNSKIIIIFVVNFNEKCLSKLAVESKVD
jgi:hypothetical protein